MDWKLELVIIPVSNVDRAKAFYERVGFNADHDHTVTPDLRFVQLTPPGSACSITLGTASPTRRSAQPARKSSCRTSRARGRNSSSEA